MQNKIDMNKMNQKMSNVNYKIQTLTLLVRGQHRASHMSVM